mgnify:CR=1 FL=1
MIYFYIKRWFNRKKKAKIREKAALVIQKNFKMRFLKNTCFVNLLELNKYPRVYFLKEQKPTFIRILRSQEPLFKKYQISLDEVFGYIREDKKF